MRTSERTEIVWELLFELVPTTRKVGILIKMGAVCHVVLLTDVSCSCVTRAVGRMITQRFHTLFGTLVDHDGVHVAARGRYPHFLENVFTSIRTVPAS
jgi:hypothetical protein